MAERTLKQDIVSALVDRLQQQIPNPAVDPMTMLTFQLSVEEAEIILPVLQAYAYQS